ncbi:unnamed protein product [Thlaspi arvense]|uniref:Uncharacterized protein n=1 Tax=Thlaspi arvense TaxID=13288 RepID=A0AAU9SJX7_THLAR|nr:unnamed protein product [Thlaspi arvense]
MRTGDLSPNNLLSLSAFLIRWSKIASQLPGRTDNEIKNVWHTHLKKRLVQISGTDSTAYEPASPCSSDSVSRGKEAKSQADGSFNRRTSQESTTSVSSGGSNKPNQEEDDPNIGFMFEYSELNDIIQEVDKPNLLEIPFDSDPDIWSFLDGSNSFQQTSANENSSASRAEEESDEDEVKKWLKHLESELGLEEDENQQHKQGKQDQKEEEESSSLLKTYELMIH